MQCALYKNLARPSSNVKVKGQCHWGHRLRFFFANFCVLYFQWMFAAACLLVCRHDNFWLGAQILPEFECQGQMSNVI